jgi:hypothetical protein
VGLGLAIVDAIAKAHGGRCTVKSSPDGSAFTLLLPGFSRLPDAEMQRDGTVLSSAAPDPWLGPDEVPQA